MPIYLYNPKTPMEMGGVHPECVAHLKTRLQENRSQLRGSIVEVDHEAFEGHLKESVSREEKRDHTTWVLPGGDTYVLSRQLNPFRKEMIKAHERGVSFLTSCSSSNYFCSDFECNSTETPFDVKKPFIKRGSLLGLCPVRAVAPPFHPSKEGSYPVYSLVQKKTHQLYWNRGSYFLSTDPCVNRVATYQNGEAAISLYRPDRGGTVLLKGVHPSVQFHLAYQTDPSRVESILGKRFPNELQKIDQENGKLFTYFLSELGALRESSRL